MHKIFLMDDDRNYLDSLELLLSAHGFQVFSSEPASNIISTIDKIKPDLIIIDYLMGDVHGGLICTELKENVKTKHIPVIVLTGYEKVFGALGNYGCDVFLSKTANSLVLVKEINRLLKVKDA